MVTGRGILFICSNDKTSWTSGAHPEQNGVIGRLRTHFFIKNVDKKVAEYVNSFSYCQMFTNKVYKHQWKPINYLKNVEKKLP